MTINDTTVESDRERLNTVAAASAVPAGSGVPGLDDIMAGGFTKGRLYLIEGAPGAGKTTLALQFMMEGARKGERVMYVTLSETEEELRASSASHGWSLEGIEVRELIPSEESLRGEVEMTMFHPAEIELGGTVQAILRVVEEFQPSRLVVDSLSELRLIAGSPLRYRRQILAMKKFFNALKVTVLLLDDMVELQQDVHVQSLVHGVMRLEQMHSEYGAERRRLRVIKYRGVRFRGGFHDYVIKKGGITTFPRLVAAENRANPEMERLASGVRPLDDLLGGGIERGTSTLVVGAAGTGKSSLSAQFVCASADRGEKSALFIFDESMNTLLTRTDGLGLSLRKHCESGAVTIQQIDPAELSPGEFAHAIRLAVEEQSASIVVIDSLNGYLSAMPEERFLIIQLHELLGYLGNAGVATLLIGAHQGLIGSAMNTPVDASYLADAVILMRYYEHRGEVKQAISVVKKRGGAHERTIREFGLTSNGIQVGEPLRNFRGTLTGVPIPLEEPESKAVRQS